MPHYTTYGGKHLAAQPIDELTGTVDALNETTNVTPSKGESSSIVDPAFKTGYDTGSIGSHAETFGDSGHSPISSESVFKPQDIDAKGGMISGDNLCMPGCDGDFITGERRQTNVWTNGSATSLENRMPKDFDGNEVAISNEIDPDIQRPTHPNENIKWDLQIIDLRSENRFVIDRFEPAPGMNRFGESLNPAFEVGISAGHGGSTSMTEQFDALKDNLCSSPCSVFTTY